MWIEFADSELEELLASNGAILRMEPMSTLHIGRGAVQELRGPGEARGRSERRGSESWERWHSAPVPLDRGDAATMRRIESPI